MHIELECRPQSNKGVRFWRSCSVMLACLAVALWLPLAGGAAEPVTDSCVDCHKNPKFLVTNPKLYEYYQKWKGSVHAQEGFSCVDCHGGNAKVADKDKSHGGKLGEADVASAVNYRNILQTCGDCHPDVYEGFRKSKHFQHVLAKGQERQGPTCITCHGSISAAVVNVNTVEQTCAQCHNEETKNRPQTPAEARELLYQFLSVQRFYRYVTVRGEPKETRAFLKDVDEKIHTLSTTWHTFDITNIQSQTHVVLEKIKAKREEVGKDYKQKHSAPKAKQE